MVEALAIAVLVGAALLAWLFTSWLIRCNARDVDSYGVGIDL